MKFSKNLFSSIISLAMVLSTVNCNVFADDEVTTEAPQEPAIVETIAEEPAVEPDVPAEVIEEAVEETPAAVEETPVVEETVQVVEPVQEQPAVEVIPTEEPVQLEEAQSVLAEEETIVEENQSADETEAEEDTETCTITYLPGEEFSDDLEEVTYDVALGEEMPEYPYEWEDTAEEAGYMLSGWTDIEGNEALDLPETVTEGNTYTAVWELIPEAEPEEDELDSSLMSTMALGAETYDNTSRTATLHPSLTGIEAAYSICRSGNIGGCSALQPLNGTTDVTFYTKNQKNDGRLVVFVKAQQGYLLTGISASGQGDLYSIDRAPSTTNLSGSPTITSDLIQQAKNNGYVAYFGYTRRWSPGSYSNENITIEVKGQTPTLTTTITSNKTENVKPGDVLTFTVNITPSVVSAESVTCIPALTEKTSVVIGDAPQSLSNIVENADGSFTGTFTYTATEADCASGAVAATVYANFDYEVKYELTNNGGYATTEANVSAEAAVQCNIATKGALSYEFAYNYNGLGADAKLPEVVATAPATVRDKYDGQTVNVASIPATVTDKVNKGVWKFDGWCDSTNRHVSQVTITAQAETHLHGTWTFIPYWITLTPKSLTVIYDGSEKSVSGFAETEFTVDGNAYTVSGLTAEAKGTNADTYTVAVTGTAKVTDAAGKDVTAQFSVATANGTLTITPRAVTITSADVSKTYDGTPLTNGAAAATYTNVISGDEASFHLQYTGTITNPGETANAFTFTENSNYTVTPAYGKLTVTKSDKKKVIEIEGAKVTATYDGAAHTATGYSIKTTDLDGITVSLKSNVTASASRTNVGKTELGLTVDSFTVASDKYNNVELQVTDGYIEITKAPLTLTAKSAKKVYDGKALTAGYDITSGELFGTDTLNVTVTGSQTDVGSTVNQITSISGDANYDIKTIDGTLEITKKEATITSGTATKVYDGTALTAGVTTEGFIEGQGVTATVTGAQTLVGESDNTFSYTANNGTNLNNYAITETVGKLTVTDRTAKYSITVEANSETATYDGKEHSASGLKSTTFTVEGNTYTVSGLTAVATGTNAGTYTTAVTGTAIVTDKAGNDVTAQFNVTTTNGTLTIAKRNVTITSSTASKVYDGTPLTKHEVTVTGDGFADGEGGTATYTGSQTIVGTSDNTFTYTLNDGTSADNYTITETAGKLTVTDRTVKYEITVEANSDTATYDGEEHSVSGLKSTTFTVEGNTYTVSGLTAKAKGTNAGTYTATVAGTANVTDAAGNDVTVQFNVTTANGTLTINKAPLTLKADDATKVYDATPLTAAGYTVTNETTLFARDHITVTTEGSQTYAGSSNNVIKSVTGADNYDVTLKNGTLIVTKADVTLKADDATKVYDGTPLTQNSYKVTSGKLFGNDQDSLRIEVTGSQLFAGDSENVITVEGTRAANYNMTLETGTLTVTKRSIELNVEGFRTEYNGEKQTFELNDSRVEKTISTSTTPVLKFVRMFMARSTEEMKIYVSLSGSVSGKDAGMHTADAMPTVTIEQVIDGVNTVVTGSFEITTNALTLTIDKAPVTIQAHSASKTYDGNTLTAPGYDITDGELFGTDTLNVTVSGSRTNVGTSANVIELGKNPNYAITAINGTLTVRERPRVTPSNNNPTNNTYAETAYMEEAPYTPETGTTRPYTPMTGTSTRRRPYTPNTSDDLDIVNWLCWMFGSIALACAAAAVVLKRKED